LGRGGAEDVEDVAEVAEVEAAAAFDALDPAALAVDAERGGTARGP
jgi:hypothetical protein